MQQYSSYVGSVESAKVATAPLTPISSMAGALEQLAKKISVLREMAYQLEGRLEPILHTSSPTTNGKEAQPSSDVPIINALLSMEQSVDEVLVTINRIMNRASI